VRPLTHISTLDEGQITAREPESARTHTHHFYVWDAFHFQTLFLANGIYFTSAPQFTGNFFAPTLSRRQRSHSQFSALLRGGCRGKGCCAAAAHSLARSLARAHRMYKKQVKWKIATFLFPLALKMWHFLNFRSAGVDIEYWAARERSGVKLSFSTKASSAVETRELPFYSPTSRWKLLFTVASQSFCLIISAMSG
jgi:hypothetical protein